MVKLIWRISGDESRWDLTVNEGFDEFSQTSFSPVLANVKLIKNYDPAT